MTEEDIEKQSEKYLKSKDWNWEQNQVMGNEVTQAFQDGAKWGYEKGYEDCRHYAHDYYKPKWHEIKCCSQDLPPRSKDNYLHSVVVSNEYGEPIYYDYNIDEWCDMEGDVVSDGYNHWCELPQFKDKE